MKITKRVFMASVTEIEVISSTPNQPVPLEAGLVDPQSEVRGKTRPRLTQPLLYLAAGAIAAFSITFFRCDHSEKNTYVHAESGSVVHVVNGEPATGREAGDGSRRVGSP